MPLNLRSKSFEMYMVDNAGNVLRNVPIDIKKNNGYSNIIVYSGRTDGSGKFTSCPLPSGIYQIFESNNFIGFINHFHDNNIQAFSPSEYNIVKNSYCNFNLNIGASNNLNNFRWFLQIEPENILIVYNGSSYPLYEKELQGEEYDNISNFFSMTSESRITTTRFDIEYCLQKTYLNSLSKKIRWAGVPGIRFKNDTCIVVPLDYYSFVPKFYKLKIATNAFFNFDDEIINVVDSTGINVGDIIKIVTADTIPKFYYKIVQEISPTGDTVDIYTKKWLSSNFLSNPLGGLSEGITLYVYDGLFGNLTSIVDPTNFFSITENNFAQNSIFELYYYSALQ